MIQQFEDNIDLVQMLGLSEENQYGHLLNDSVSLSSNCYTVRITKGVSGQKVGVNMKIFEKVRG